MVQIKLSIYCYCNLQINFMKRVCLAFHGIWSNYLTFHISLRQLLKPIFFPCPLNQADTNAALVFQIGPLHKKSLGHWFSHPPFFSYLHHGLIAHYFFSLYQKFVVFVHVTSQIIWWLEENSWLFVSFNTMIWHCSYKDMIINVGRNVDILYTL